MLLISSEMASLVIYNKVAFVQYPQSNLFITYIYMNELLSEVVTNSIMNELIN